MSLYTLLRLAPFALLPFLAHAQDEGGEEEAPATGDDGAAAPIFPTLDSLAMFGTGCPTGGGQGVGVGAVDGTPVFGFSEWGLDLADLDVPLSEEEIAAGLEPPTEVEKFCVEEMKLGGGPPGYKVRVPAVTVGGVAALEEGSALRISIETTIGGEEGGGNEIVLLPADITDGAFEARIENPSEVWSECIADDGVVPLIGVKTSLALFREGDEATAGTVGADDDSAVTVHFAAVWEEC